MALRLVLENFISRDLTLSAGQLIDDGLYDVTALRDAGLSEMPFVVALQPVVDAYLAQKRVNPLAEGDLMTLIQRSLQGATSILTTTGQTVEQALAGGGFGDVVGPAASTDNAIARFDGVTGKLLQNSTPTVQDDGRISSVTDPTGPQDAATKAYVDALEAGEVPATRLLTAGAGLTGGGNLTADRTFDVGANADGSIVVNANDVQVGVLATDAQHGVRGGGTQHAVVVPAGAAGFMSGADKTKLDGIATGATNTPLTASAPADVTKAAAAVGVATDAARADHKHDITTATAVTLSAPGANAEGAATTLARSDHTHALPVVPSTLVWGNGSVAATTTTRYLQPGFDTATAPTSPTQIRCPRAGTLRNLQLRHNTTAGNGNAIVYTVRKNGVAQTLTVSLASTTQNGSDLANSFTVAQGDTLDIEVTKAASVATSPSEITATVEYAP